MSKLYPMRFEPILKPYLWGGQNLAKLFNHIPKNSKVVVNKCKNQGALANINARQNSGVRGNFIVGDDRALILAGPVNRNEIGFWTVEKEIVEQLKEDFDQKWEEGSKMHQGKET